MPKLDRANAPYVIQEQIKVEYLIGLGSEGGVCVEVTRKSGPLKFGWEIPGRVGGKGVVWKGNWKADGRGTHSFVGR